MFRYVSQNGSDLSTIFAPNAITTDMSFSSLISYTRAIQNYYVIASSNISFTSNFPNVIYINSASNFSITLPTNPSQSGIVIYVRQVSGTSALTISYPNGVRITNTQVTSVAYMSYSLCSLPAGLNYWYLFHHL